MRTSFHRLAVWPIALLLLLPAVGCDSTSSNDDEFPAPELTVVQDLPADPFVDFAPDGRPIGTGHYTFYSLREDRTVAPEDSASSDWDLAFQGTTIRVNAGTSGPGGGGAQVVEGIFEEITEAPADGWQTDGADGLAIPAGSGTGWYNYNPAAMVVTPIPGRVLLIRTADGRFAKIRIVSYYKGAPDTPDATDEARYFTFDYLFQPDGSRVLE